MKKKSKEKTKEVEVTIPEVTDTPEKKRENKLKVFASKIKKWFKDVPKNWKKDIILVVIILVLGLLINFIVSPKGESLIERTFNKIIGNEEENYNKIKSITYEGKNDYLETKSVFTVKTSGSLKEEDFNKYLMVEPAYDYTVEKVKKNEYKVTIDNITGNQIVNLNYVENNKPVYKWAYESSKDLAISSIYPRNGAKVSSDSVIEVNLTYANVENFEKSVSIEPAVDGSWEHLGRTWRFTPTDSLKDKTTYTVIVKNTITHGDLKMNNEYSSKFTVSNDTDDDGEEYAEGLSFNSITVDNITTFRPTESIKIAYYDYENEDSPTKVTVYKFDSASDFEKYLTTGKGSYKKQGDYKFKNYNKETIELTEKLGIGYYLVAVKGKNTNGFTVPVQVNSYSAYAYASERDVLVWVAKDGKFQKDLKVSYEKKDATTNEEGIAKITNYTDGSGKVKYVKIDSDSKNPLYIGIENGNINNYPEAYVYCDRPLYKNTDTVSIWGFVPLSFFADSPDRDKFSIEFSDRKYPVSVDKNGNFTTKLDLKNIESNDDVIYLYYNNSIVGSTSITVENYTLRNYNYEIDTNKEYLINGETFKFGVKVKHVSGIPAANKDVIIEYNEKEYKAKTDNSGYATFSIKINEEVGEYTPFGYAYFTITNAGPGYDENEYYLYSADVLDKLMYIEDYDDAYKDGTINMNVYSLDPSKKNVSYPLEESLSSPYNGKVHMIVYEEVNTRKLTGYEYDDYLKKKVPTYDYETEDKTVIDKMVTVKDGKLSEKIDYNFKKATAEKSYNYTAEIIATDKNNKKLVVTSYLLYEWYEGDNDDDDLVGYVDSYYDYNYYDLYRYYYESDKNSQYEDFSPYDDYEYFGLNMGKYSIDDTISLTLYDYKNNKISNDNKVLFIKNKERILDYKLNPSNKIEAKFDEKSNPGINGTLAYFDGTNFFRTPVRYYDYNEQDRKVNVSITTDKENYSPKGEVKVKIKTTDKNGKGIKTNLNVSVVNEAIFGGANYNPILETIYLNRYYDGYTYSTYRDFDLMMSGGGAGNETGDGTRNDFGDTLLFKSLTTDDKGEATVTFKLNDSITSFRITVHASNSDNYVGVGTKKISSTIPLAIDFIKPEYLKSSDDVVLNATTLGNNNGNINYVFKIKEINKEQKVTGKSGVTVYSNFGTLKEGEYTAEISATDGKNTDKVSYKFKVVKTLQEINIKTTTNLKETKKIKPTKNPIIMEMYYKNLDVYLNYLDDLENTINTRLDTIVGYREAERYIAKLYDEEYNVDTSNYEKYYITDKDAFSSLEAAKEDYLLTALLLYYSNEVDSYISSSTYYSALEEQEEEGPTVVDALLVLAAMKEPILNDLKQLDLDNLSKEDLYKVDLSYLFIGDYDQAKEVHKKIEKADNEEGVNYDSLEAIVSTFIDKKKAEDNINKVKMSDNYIRFAILSYFDNNIDKIMKDKKVTIKIGNEKKEVNLKGLKIEKFTLYDEELDEISFDNKSKDIIINYYYQGNISEAKNVKQVIKTTLTGEQKVGKTIYLNIDISKYKDKGGLLHVYIPSNVSVSQTDVSIDSIKDNHAVIWISNYSPDIIKIPLYIKQPGKSLIESVILKSDDKYYISNELEINTK